MPRVAPFRGLHYSLDRFGASGERVAVPEDAATPPPRLADITEVACPPYDVISAEDRAELLARDEHNAVRLEYSPEPDPHAAAAETLAAWLADGTLVRRDEPAAYYYRHATSANRDELTVEGIVVRVLVEPWGDAIRPHEHTMPGPKQDRLGLLRATGTQLSPILAVYFDRSERYNHVMGRAWSDEWRARDDDGLLHQLTAIEADDRLTGYLGRQTLYIADGHHRYETALAYQEEVRSNPRFADAPPGEVDAVLGYCLALRREALAAVGGFDPRFRYYRNADLDLSFAVRDRGWRALATGELPLRRHEHRGWTALPDAERDRLSRRNFYRFLEHWGRRPDLLLARER